jgi:hypothetical protein
VFHFIFRLNISSVYTPLAALYATLLGPDFGIFLPLDLALAALVAVVNAAFALVKMPFLPYDALFFNALTPADTARLNLLFFFGGALAARSTLAGVLKAVNCSVNGCVTGAIA